MLHNTFSDIHTLSEVCQTLIFSLLLRPDSAKWLADACVCERFTKQVLGLTPQNHSFMNPQLFVPYKLCQQVYHLARYSGPFILSLVVIQAGGVGGIAAKALEGALRPETESTAYKKLRHSAFVSQFLLAVSPAEALPGPSSDSPTPPAVSFSAIEHPRNPLGTIRSEQLLESYLFYLFFRILLDTLP